MPKPLSQQVAVIVGASSGIGRATAIEFAKMGAKLVVTARSELGIQTLVDHIKQVGPTQVHGIACDVSNPESLGKVLALAIEKFGRIDTFVNAAAVTIFGTVEQTTPEEYQQVMNINFIGQVRGAQMVLPHLKQSKGCLISVSSVEAYRALPLQSAYAASKHALAAFLSALRTEMMHDKSGVQIVSINPSNIDTPLYDKARVKCGVTKYTGAPPTYSPELCARSIAFAATHRCNEIIVGDGGYMITWVQTIFPNFLDWMLSWDMAWRAMDSGIPKNKDEDNVDRGIDKYNTIHGHCGKKPIDWSVYNWSYEKVVSMKEYMLSWFVTNQ